MMEMWQQIKNWWKTQSFGERFLFMVALLTSLVLAVYLYGTYMDVNGRFRGTIDKNGTRTLILLMAGIIGWYFLLRRTKATEQSAKAAEQSLTTERLTRAIGQLDNNKVYVRMGGVLGLQQIGLSENTDEDERKKIALILVSFIRTRATKNSKESQDMTTKIKDVKDKEEKDQILDLYRVPRSDIEAAVNSLARIASTLTYRDQYNETKRHLCDLRNTDLRGLRFVEADLSEFDIENVDFSGTWLRDANLSRAIANTANFTLAYLENTNLHEAFLNYTNFSDARLTSADFSEAYLIKAVFVEAYMNQVNLSNTKLIKANLTKAWLHEANFSNALLNDTNLSGASLLNVEGLTQPQIDSAFRYTGKITYVISADESQILKEPPEREPPKKENKDESGGEKE